MYTFHNVPYPVIIRGSSEFLINLFDTQCEVTRQRRQLEACFWIEYLDWAIGSHISNNYSVPISHISILYDHYISIIVHLFALACSNSVKNDLGMFVLSPFRAALLDCLLRAFTQPSLNTNPSTRLCHSKMSSYSKMQLLLQVLLFDESWDFLFLFKYRIFSIGISW